MRVVASTKEPKEQKECKEQEGKKWPDQSTAFWEKFRSYCTSNPVSWFL